MRSIANESFELGEIHQLRDGRRLELMLQSLEER
jgi:hypothetical protein